MICPRCQAAVPDAGRFCPACGRPMAVTLPPSAATSAGLSIVGEPDVTALAANVPAAPGTVTASSGWLTSSGSIDHGRFPPGTIVDGRYRVIGLLGRGGMGEVYRADDLRLGQPVALKVLPDGLGRDPVRLAQFHNEVRTARQVSHPNICRVHDIGETDGLLYLSMEYVAGEDLATSLRRIGRFPEDKALEIARQLCAGLAAAHARGIVHRDLKPANVMLDADGRVRVMDFGLAAVGEVTDVRAGTPAYMAPEQLLGREVSARSDVFALGLVLYELFTGRRAFQAATLAELVAQHAAMTIVPLTSIVAALDPAIDRAVLSCLEADPLRRPASALAVSAALPGGDPLAAALAAGETPSPEMVAAAGGASATLAPANGLALVGAVALLVGLCVMLGARHQVTARAGVTLEPTVLADRARTLERGAGLGGDAVDRARGLFTNADIENWLQGLPDAARARHLVSGWPSPLLFWYRSSPRPLVPVDPTRLQPGRGDPPLAVTGMTTVLLDMQGRLLEFASVPIQIESRVVGSDTPVDWTAFLEAAGFDPSRFTPATPDFTPRVFADARVAWTGTAPDLIDAPLRVEAASHRGTPVSFVIMGPWSRAARMEAPRVDPTTRVASVVTWAVVVPGCLLGGMALVRRNLRLGLGDRRAALTLTIAVFWLELARRILGAAHFADAVIEASRVFALCAQSLFAAVIAGTFYLALEPSVRRNRPHLLIAWTRVLSGRLRDPVVGRDLLIGVCAGLLLTAITFGHYLLPGVFGWTEFQPAPVALTSLDGALATSVVALTALLEALQLALLGGTGLVLAGRLVSRAWVGFAILVLLFSFTAAEGQFETGRLWLNLLLGAVSAAVVLAIILRFGFVAGVTAFFAHLLSKNVPLTADPSLFYFPGSLFVVSIVLGLALTGLVLARAGEPLLGRR